MADGASGCCVCGSMASFGQDDDDDDDVVVVVGSDSSIKDGPNGD